MLKSSNPIFKKALENEFENADYEVATYSGVTKKVLLYLGITVLGAFGGLMLLGYNPEAFTIMIALSGIFTFIFAVMGMISPKLSKVCGSLYCFFEGALIGFISALYEEVVGGVILATLISTFTVVLVSSTLFLTGIVKVNGKFKKVLLTFSISVILSMTFLYLFSLFGNYEFNFGINLIASLIMVFIASLYIMLDMENIVQICEGKFPKIYEWYAAFGLVYTILWIYIEILPVIVSIFADNN